MSYKALGLIPCSFFLLAISFAIASDNNETQALRLYSSDAENAESIPPDSVIGQSRNGENADFGDLDCCQSCCCPRWTATADVMILERVGNKNDLGDFGREIEAGPRISLIRQTQCCDYEILFFSFDGTSSTVVTSPNPLFAELPFGWSSRLYNVELNARWNPSSQLALLAGFRWAQYRDEFQLLNPPDIKTNNNLYGFQVGADAWLWQRGCFSIEGLCKVGLYGNHAEQSTTLPVEIDPQSRTFSVSGSHTDFIGELGLQARYQVSRRFAVRAGYELLWLDGVAIGSVQRNFNGIDTNSTVFYQGATAGFELSF